MKKNVSRLIKRLFTFAIVFAMVVGVIQPGQASIVSAKAVKISQSKLELTIGQKKTLKVNGTKEKATWSSSNKKVATVGKTNGKVTAVSTGNTTITAKIGKKQYRCKVTVKPFKTQTVTLMNNTTFELPKGYIVTESSEIGLIRAQINMSLSSKSIIMYINTAYQSTISDDEFVEKMRAELNEEIYESQLKLQLNVEELKLDNFELKEQKIGKRQGVVVSMSFEYSGILMNITQYMVNFDDSCVQLIVNDVDGCGNQKDVVEWIINTIEF